MHNLTDLNKNRTSLALPNLKEKVANYAKNAFAKNTILNYKSDWRNFAKWTHLEPTQKKTQS